MKFTVVLALTVAFAGLTAHGVGAAPRLMVGEHFTNGG